MRIFVIAAISVLAACSSPAPLHYYQLPAVAGSGQHSTEAAVLYIAPVQVASYLNGKGLILQLSEVELHVARQHLWAEPLAAQVQRQLRELITSTTSYATTLDAKPGAVVLTVVLERFQGTAQGNAVLSGRYQLSNVNHSAAFEIRVPLSADGYPALVTALAAGLQQLSQQISVSLSVDNTIKLSDG